MLVLLSTNILLAQENNDAWQKKHKGLDFKVRGGYSVGIRKAEGFDMINLDASIGKRLDWMYLGIGSGAWLGTSSGADPIIPITLDWEAFITEGRITPTALLRVGYAINTAEDIKIMGETIKQPNCLVFQAMPGIRFGVTRRVDFDLALGMTAMTSVGGSPGTNGTSVYLSVSGALNFHKTTKPKPQKPIRESGMQVTIEGNWFGFAGGDLNYEGEGAALALTYKFNHKLSAGIGMGMGAYGDGVEGTTKYFLRGQYNLTSKRFSPFIACDAGMHINRYYDDSKPKSTDFYVDPSIGLSIRTTNNSYLDLKVGYSLTTVDVTNYDMYFTESENSVSGSAPFISLGFRHTFGWGSKWFK